MVLRSIEQKIFSGKYYDKDKEKIADYEKSILSSIENSLNINNPTSTIENEFCHLNDIIDDQKDDLEEFVKKIKKKIIRDLKTLPISSVRFPHFVSSNINVLYAEDNPASDEPNSSEKDEKNQILKDEEKMKKILTKTETEISLIDLNEFYEILKKYKKPFTFSPSFILDCIQKVDSLFTVLHSNLNKPSQNSSDNIHKYFQYIRSFKSRNCATMEEKTLFIYFELILLIKMRLFMMIHKIHDFLTILLEFIIIEQEYSQLMTDNDYFSFKKTVIDCLPSTKQRSKIIEKFQFDDIIDFHMSKTGRNDFILSKNGLYRSTNSSSYEKVEFKTLENIEIIENLTKSDKYYSQILYKDGDLLIMNVESKSVYIIPASFLDKDKETIIERKAVDIPDFPLISFAVNDIKGRKTFQIIQKKSCFNDKTTLL